ncbi:hypothetical protein JW935_18845 [candidate division KSB1 bacterium]|nr:hypothetical protein [candidate division KSB1 bacterium]
MLNRFYIIIFVIVAMGACVFGQEDIFFAGTTRGAGVRSLSMGGAYVGIADDNSAIYWNPAGMGQIRRMELNVGFAHNKMGNEAVFLGNTSNSSHSFTRLNSIGFTYPVPTYQGSLVLGLAYNKVRDFDEIIEIEGFNTEYSPFVDFFSQSNPLNYYTDILDSLYQIESILHEGSLNHFSIAGAIELAPNFFAGATLNFIGGVDDRNLNFEEVDVQNIYNTEPTALDNGDTLISDLDSWNYSENLNSRLSAANIKLGALYQWGRTLRLGATVTPPTKYKIKEKWSDQWEEFYDFDFSQSIPPEPAEWEYEIQTPFIFEAGASFQFLNVLVSGSAEFNDWTQAKFKTDPPVEGITKGEVNSRIKSDLKATTNIRVGTEVYIPLVKARVRAGYNIVPSPYRYEKVNSDKETISAGLSFLAGRQVMVNIALANTAWKIQTRDYFTDAPALEKKNIISAIAGVTVRF